MRYTSNVNGKLEDAATYFERPTLRVYYEDFNQRPVETARSLLPSIGLPKSTRVWPSKFHKTGSDNIRDFVGNYNELCEYLDSIHSQYRCTAGGTITATFKGVSSKELASAQESSAGGDAGGAWELGVDPPAAEVSVSHGPGGMMMQQQKLLGKNRTTVVFKHIHKAGGTTLCRVAMENMQADKSSLPNKPDWGTNCVPREAFLHLGHPAGRQAVMDLSAAAGGAWLGGACFFGRLTLPQQKALPQHYFPLTFIASEGPLPDTMLTQPPYTLITMFRNPVDRTLSSYNWWRHMAEKFGHGNAALCGLYSISNQKPTLLEWLQEYPDNWMVRSFNGRSAFIASGKTRDLPVMTRENLAFAKERLELFSAVLIMERYEDSMAFLRELLGWKTTAHSLLRSGSRFNSSAHSVALHSEALKALESHNALDAELYDYAVQLFERQRTAIGNSR